MLNVTLRLVEFLDAFPLPGCRTRLQARVVAGWNVRVADGPAEGADGSPNPLPGNPAAFELEFDEARATKVEAEAITDSQGVARLSLSLNSAFNDARSLRRDGKAPDAVEAQMSVDADIYGLKLKAAYTFEAISSPSGDLERILVADPAKSIVGDTSSAHTTLWFQLHAPSQRTQQFTCVLRPLAGGPEQRLPVIFDPLRAETSTVVARGLSAATRYVYALYLTSEAPERLLTRGAFMTFQANPTKLNIAFVSCHLPSTPTALNRWQALAARDNVDLMIHLGDQIYGDGIESQWPQPSWSERYERRYNQLWQYQPVRDVLRSRPNYMTLDDHELKDDFGVAVIDEDRRDAALRAYRLFQQAHNPGGPDPASIDYSFERGSAAFYVSDSRTARGQDPDYPILGRAQYGRMEQWARSPVVRNADLIFMVTAVPPGGLPIKALEDLAGAASPVAGGLAGALAGALLPGGPLLGAFVGAVGAKLIYEHLEDTLLDPDIRDSWAYDKNLPDLVRTLDLLFNLANDIGDDGRPGPRPRGVFLLAGDYHFGSMHQIRSKRTDAGHDHRTNPTILQVTSSPISYTPTSQAEKMVAAAGLVAHDGEFRLDDDHYASRFKAHTNQRNFGRITFERISDASRRYRISAYVEAETEALTEIYELDLDARPVAVRDLRGELLNTQGRLTLLRVHDIGTDFGESTDRIQGEVIISLDTEPGRAFGFQLRKDLQLPAHRRMLGVLRDAFAHGDLVSIDYRRIGDRNGTLIRLNRLPSPPGLRLRQTVATEMIP